MLASMSQPGQSRALDRRPPVWLIYAVTVTGITVNTLVTAGVPDILDGLGASRSLAGILVAAPTVPGIVMAPAIGILADRFGRREVLVPCLVVFGLAGGLCAVAPTLLVLVVLRAVQGIGAAGLINLAVVLIGDHWDGTERVRIVGGNAAALTIALAILPFVGGSLTDLTGWRGPFVVYLASLVTASVVARTLPRARRPNLGVRQQLAQAVPQLRAPVMVASLLAAVLVFVLIFGGMLTVLPIYARERFGLGATARGVLAGLPAITSTMGSATIARLVARYGRRRPLIAAPLLFAASMAAMAWAPSLPALCVGILIFGLGEGLVIPSLQDAVTGTAPSESRGTLYAAFVGASRLGQAAGPLAAAAGMGAVGAQPTFAAGVGVSLMLVGVAWRLARALPR